jgi:hypothetical protein
MRVFVAIALACFPVRVQRRHAVPHVADHHDPAQWPFRLRAGRGVPTLMGVSLSGVVYELTPTGRTPIAGAIVYCEPCGESNAHIRLPPTRMASTTSREISRGRRCLGGRGSADPRCRGSLQQRFSKTRQYYRRRQGPGWREVLIDGDTIFDIELVRRSRGADET